MRPAENLMLAELVLLMPAQYIAGSLESYRQFLVTTGAGQAAAVAGRGAGDPAITSSPSANFTPRMSFGNWA